MSYTTLAQSAADWALSKVGCAYSQARRTQEDIFDCSSLVARAGGHLRLFLPRRPHLLRAAYPFILTPTHPGDGTDHRAIPLFTEVTEYEPYRPMA